MQDINQMTVKEIEAEYAELRAEFSRSPPNSRRPRQARANKLIKHLILKRRNMFEISTKDLNTMTVDEIVAEFKEIKSELGRPNDPSVGWYGYSSSMVNQLNQRRQQLVERMADEYLKQHEINILLGEN